jgi:hypothetical protein
MVFAAFHVGKIAGTVAGGWWLAAQDAAHVAARARRLAGISPDLATTGHRGGAQRSATALGAEAAAEARWQGRGSEATLAGIFAKWAQPAVDDSRDPNTVQACKRRPVTQLI